MNRFQYNNAVVDLLDLQGVVYALPERILRDHDGYFQPQTGKMPTVVKVGCRPLGKSQLIEKRLGGVAPFPQDLRAEHGFDNRSDHLSLSPLLLEGFLRLSQSIVESPDFKTDRVGIWMQCFAPPPEDQDMQEAVAVRLRPLMRKAFRGNTDEETYQRYIDYALKQWRSGKGFTDSMKAALAAILSSPRFLYLYQEAPVETTLEDASLKGLELASRLSFFLWGSLPDEPLLEAALNGELVLDQGLEKQFHRMLSHPRLKRFCDSFPSQWLQLDRIISSAPDKESFPGFYFLKYRDSMHMVLEPLLLFETVLIENLSISQFIQSNFTYRSKLLQEAYGELGIGEKPIQGNQEVTVLRFERYPVEDPRIGGLITNAAVMTMTSGPEDTKPITRGSWMATVFSIVHLNLPLPTFRPYPKRNPWRHMARPFANDFRHTGNRHSAGVVMRKSTLSDLPSKITAPSVVERSICEWSQGRHGRHLVWAGTLSRHQELQGIASEPSGPLCPCAEQTPHELRSGKTSRAFGPGCLEPHHPPDST